MIWFEREQGNLRTLSLCQLCYPFCQVSSCINRRQMQLLRGSTVSPLWSARNVNSSRSHLRVHRFSIISPANEMSLEHRSWASIIRSKAPKLCTTPASRVIELPDVFITGSIWQADDRDEESWKPNPEFCLLNLDTRVFVIKRKISTLPALW